MGRYLGAFDEDSDIDRPDLNKCPVCSCYFEQDTCPICGMLCPAEMRAGNRKAVKQKKRKPSSGRDRVYFIDWYHRWWFIILMAFFMPLVSLILLLTSPRPRNHKIIAIVVAVVLMIVWTVGVGNIIGVFQNLFDNPVDTSLSEEAYIAKCESVDVEDFFRYPDQYKDKFVALTVTVGNKTMDYDAHFRDGAYCYYYYCTETDGTTFRILVRDCAQKGSTNFVKGDVIVIYGEGAGFAEFYDAQYEPVHAPCLNMAYYEIQE